MEGRTEYVGDIDDTSLFVGEDRLTSGHLDTKSSGIFDRLLFLCVVPYESVFMPHLMNGSTIKFRWIKQLCKDIEMMQLT